MSVQRTVSIPEGVTVTMTDFLLKVKGPKGELQREMWHPIIRITIEDGNAVFTTDSSKKQVVAMVGTLASHCKNMCTGVTSGYLYSLKVVYSHFPIQLKL